MSAKEDKEKLNSNKEYSSEELDKINLIFSIINKVMKKTPFHAVMMNQAAASNAFSVSPHMFGKYEEGELTLVQPQKGESPLPREVVSTNHEMIDQWKVIVNISYDNKRTFIKLDTNKMKVFRRLMILPPKYICTGNYLICATFSSEKEAQNCISYLKTKFVRFLISRVVTVGSLSRKSLKLVPIQEMNKPWTDEELYEKYELTPEEIDVIESKIREL